MSLRMTDSDILYLIASNPAECEAKWNIEFSVKEKQCLEEYLQTYKKFSSLCWKLSFYRGSVNLSMENNEDTIEYVKLCQESDLIKEEIDRLVKTPTLQKVLSYREAYFQRPIDIPDLPKDVQNEIDEKAKAAKLDISREEVKPKYKISEDALWLIVPFLIQAVLFFIAIADLPYAFYSVLRVETFFLLGFVCFACFCDIDNRWTEGALTFFIVLIFNPIFPFYSDKDTWVVIDACCGIVLLLLCLYVVFKDIKRNKR